MIRGSEQSREREVTPQVFALPTFPAPTPPNALATHRAGNPETTGNYLIEPHLIGAHLKVFSCSSPRAGESLLVRLLWAAFPSSSQKALAEKAAPVLMKTPRQIENILAGVNDGKAKDTERLILRLRILYGVEKLAQIIEGTPER